MRKENIEKVFEIGKGQIEWELKCTLDTLESVLRNFKVDDDSSLYSLEVANKSSNSNFEKVKNLELEFPYLQKRYEAMLPEINKYLKSASSEVGK